jgi:hypothetical protein
MWVYVLIAAGVALLALLVRDLVWASRNPYQGDKDI